MQVRVLYFAVVRERLGRAEQALELPDGANVAGALDRLAAEHPAVQALRNHLRVAVNQDLADAETLLRDGDEIALIPPVAGGSGLFRLQEAPLSVDEALAAVAGPDNGGTALFIGTVRRESRGRRVERLEYEAYGNMAVRQLARIGEELGRAHGARLAILHRVGRLEVGEAAVVIAAAAPHRAEAFAACREAIERLKEEVPIWKQEIGEDGAVWVGLGP